MTLRGEERQESLKRHQKHGEYILWAGISLALIAFIARAISGYIVEGDATSDLLPQSIHGYTGPIGLILLWIVVRHGRETVSNKENSEKFSAQRMKHGRAADLVMILIMFHSFLGFIYVFQVL